MSFYADLHIHSKWSRAVSQKMDLPGIRYAAARAGLTVVGTGDFTHPGWFEELQATLVPAEPGLFRLRDDLERAVDRRLPPSCRGPVRFMLSVEISTIYKRAERTRKVHHLLYMPDLEAAAACTARLLRIGNLAYDGRPIVGLDSRDLLEVTLESGDGAYLVPAHAWTPWFSPLGSKSGFDAVEDCYADLAGHVFALETGLSADPAMCWRVSALDRYRLVSNSDAHSPPALGREATVLDTELDYFAIRGALETGEGFGGTVEFFPEEGKYHVDGHRKCGVRLEPAESRRLGDRCPVCGKPLTVGVLHRVEELADRPEGFRPPGAAGFRNLIQLPQLVGEVLGVGPKSKGVGATVAAMVERLGPELEILERVPVEAIAKAASPLVAEAVDRVRRGAVIREPGYDGEYGVLRVFGPEELRAPSSAATLFEPQPAPSAPLAPSNAPPPPVAEAVRSPAGARRPLPAPTAPAPTSVLAGLDPDQRAAAVAGPGPLLIVAGPGTGKTRTLTHRLAHLVSGRGVPPEHCLAITFTRRACAELQERLNALVPAQAPRMLVTTFHGLGPGFRVADDAERLEVLREQLGCGEREARRLLPELVRRKRARAARWPDLDPEPSEVAAPLARYEAALRKLDLVDLDDLLVLPVMLLAADATVAARYRDRYRLVAVDEYQDVDELQYRLLRLLTTPDGDVCVIGDPDQAIYGFRGADVGFFLRFAEDFPAARTVRLTRNYRSSAVIVAGALQAIAPATLVRDRVLGPVAGGTAHRRRRGGGRHPPCRPTCAGQPGGGRAAGPAGRALRGRRRPLPGGAGTRRGGGHLGPAGGQGLAAHPPRRQGPRVPGGVPGRLRGRAAAAALGRPAQSRAGGRGAPAVLRRHDQGPLPPVPEPRAPARLAWVGPRRRPVPVPDRHRGGPARPPPRGRQAPAGARRRRPAHAALAGAQSLPQSQGKMEMSDKPPWLPITVP